MPAHITHLIFAEDALRAALGAEAEQILGRHGNFLRLGAQGPDLFYHSQRTRPTALLYGMRIHREGFGRLAAAMAREIRRHGAGGNPEVEAFLLGFATHAALDRRTHPYINYFAGWVDPRRPETRRYYRCHSFLERVLDVQILRLRRGADIRRYAFLPQIACGPELPYPLLKVLVKSLHQAYPRTQARSRIRRRLENAYRDALFFYQITEPNRPLYRRMARARDRIRNNNRLRLALYHPLEIPAEIDFLNLGRREWMHPCFAEQRSTATFLELYEGALGEAADALRKLREALGAPPQAGPAAGAPAADGPAAVDLAALLGNGSLDMAAGDGRRCPPRFCSPLPLPELIEAQYHSRP